MILLLVVELKTIIAELSLRKEFVYSPCYVSILHGKQVHSHNATLHYPGFHFDKNLHQSGHHS